MKLSIAALAGFAVLCLGACPATAAPSCDDAYDAMLAAQDQVKAASQETAKLGDTFPDIDEMSEEEASQAMRRYCVASTFRTLEQAQTALADAIAASGVVEQVCTMAGDLDDAQRLITNATKARQTLVSMVEQNKRDCAGYGY